MQQQDRSRKVTIEHVAEEAGVSKSTVSLVLKNSPLISSGKAEAVRAAVKRLGYVYNRTAANLRAQRTHIVGVVTCDISNPYFAELFTAVADKLEREGMMVMLANTAEDPDRQRRAVATLLEHNVDGLFISPAKYSRPEHVEPLLDSALPTVFVTRYIPGFRGCYVGADNARGARMATERLLAAGHRRIAFIGAQHGSTAAGERLRGFEEAFEAYGLATDSAIVLEVEATRRGGSEAANRLMALRNPPTAAFCFNDVIALGLLLGLQAHGITPGRDFAVFGFDDVSEARLCSPTLSTVSAPPDAIGKRAADLFIQAMESPGCVNTVLVSPSLVVRESCGTSTVPA